MLRLLSASVAAATRAGNIIREVMSTGKLGIVDKVFSLIEYVKLKISNSLSFSPCYTISCREVTTLRRRPIERHSAVSSLALPNVFPASEWREKR